MTEQGPPDRRAEIEAWWALVARILAFFLGCVILSFSAFVLEAELVEKLIWAAIGLGLMGPVAINGVAQALDAIRGKGGP